MSLPLTPPDEPIDMDAWYGSIDVRIDAPEIETDEDCRAGLRQRPALGVSEPLEVFGRQYGDDAVTALNL